MATATRIDWVRGPVLFVAIVWSIALTFLILDTVTYRLIDWGYRSAIISDEYGMPTPSREAVATCATRVQNSMAMSSTAVTPQQARLLAWKMGTGFGFAVALERAGAIDAAKRQEAVNEIGPLGQVLLVPTPIPPPSGPSAGALPEYGQLIEDDQACTSAFLAHHYGLPVSHLYKLGALTGFVVVYRTVCPECGALFVAQVRHHAKEAGCQNRPGGHSPKHLPRMRAPRFGSRKPWRSCRLSIIGLGNAPNNVKGRRNNFSFTFVETGLASDSRRPELERVETHSLLAPN